MKIFQHATLTSDPTQAMDAVTKQYVDQAVQTGVGGAAQGGLFFTDVSPTTTGIVGSKLYVSNTVPANAVITEATTDTDNVTVTLYAEGGSTFFSPSVTITTVPAQAGGPVAATLTVNAADRRTFTATANLTGITADTTITATSSTNAETSIIIRRAVAGPNVNVLQIGALPEGQTEVKSGDVVTFSGRVPNSASYVEVIAGGAASSLVVATVGAIDSFGAGYREFSGSFTVSGLTGTQYITARAKNALGTFGSNLQSTNFVTLNQTYPTIGARTITYPVGQSALKGTESATIAATVTNADTVTYSTSADLTATTTSGYVATNTVTRVSGTYAYGTNNYTITAKKSSNGATTTASAAVSIANAAPSAAISITGNPARLRSTPSGQDYVITVTANQRLNVAPAIVASSGTWQGSWTGSGNTWIRTLRIADADPKGGQTFTATLTNIANVTGSTLTAGSTYTVGGFSTRTITFSAFERYHAIGTDVVDITKVTASYTGSTVLTRYTDTLSHFQGFTIVDAAGNYSPTGGYLFISDADFASSNTTGTLQLDVTEAV